jgi:hypothetical protein
VREWPESHALRYVKIAAEEGIVGERPWRDLKSANFRVRAWDEFGAISE